MAEQGQLCNAEALLEAQYIAEQRQITGVATLLGRYRCIATPRSTRPELEVDLQYASFTMHTLNKRQSMSSNKDSWYARKCCNG